MTTFAPILPPWRWPRFDWRWVVRLVAGILALTLAAEIAFHAPPARAAARPRPVHAKAASVNSNEPAFRKFVAELWPLAEARGVSRTTFDDAFRGVSFDPRIVAHTHNQAEFVRPIWAYLASAVTPARIERGRAKAEEQRVWLDKAQSTYGVDLAIIMGIWGMETEFGAYQGGDSVIRALASLAFVHFRGDYFRDELIAALVILEEGDIGARDMRGSWAGAMGQTQFMPSSFNEYAIDFEGHGRRDIWNSAPDAIGSTANYLAKHGWIADLPWGFEARLPPGFKLTNADSTRAAPFASFAKRGVTRADGGALPRSGEAQLLIPAGLHGPIFIVTANFKTIKTYNDSTAYALGVALLGDAVMGRGELHARWPVHGAALSSRDIRDMQTRLRRMGYDVGEVDGRVGDTLRAALRAYQESIGAPPDGYPTLALLHRLRRRI